MFMEPSMRFVVIFFTPLIKALEKSFLLAFTLIKSGFRWGLGAAPADTHRLTSGIRPVGATTACHPKTDSSQQS